MADFLLFDAGANKLLDSGITGACKFHLSTKAVGTEEAGQHKHGDVLAGISEITGTGYAAKEEAAPAAAAKKKSFGAQIWKTEAHTDWPAGTKSVVLENGGVALCAWNLREGGAARDLSAANTTEEFTPTFTQA